MIIIFEVLLAGVLAMILVTLITDESKQRRRARRLVKLEEYWSGQERRRVERYSIILDIKYTVDRAFKESKTKDISKKGICLMLDEKLEERSPISIEIKIDSVKRPIRAKGRVIWSREAPDEKSGGQKRLFHTGVEFTRFIDPLNKKRLFDYIRSIEEKSHRNYAGAQEG